jgi:hypothetical protein
MSPPPVVAGVDRNIADEAASFAGSLREISAASRTT